MKKIISIIPIAILFILISHNINSYADTKQLCYIVQNNFRPYICFVYVTNENSYIEFVGNNIILHGYTSWYAATYNDNVYETLYHAIDIMGSKGTMPNVNNNASTSFPNSYTPLFICSAPVRSGEPFTSYFDSLESYEDYINPPPTWWDLAAQAFTEFATSPAMGAVLSGDWLGYINEVLFGELWSVQVGEGEDELAQFYTVSATPSASPTPIPTQIPVQVNIDPTTGNVTYHYTIDVSGTPVPTSSPGNPNPPAGSCGGGSELTEPFGVTDYYEPDDSLSIPNLRIFQFQLDLPGSTTDIGVDSLDNNVEVMNGYLENNADAITTVSSFFQVIPSDWFLLLGAIACFPIIAAMIKSLLGG